jgi:2-phosphosulfolactate phosphatase
LGQGERIALASPNGGHCCALAAEAPLLLAASLLNAAAVSAGVARLLDERDDLCVTVVACGERWTTPNEDGDLRFAIEDYLAAGAVLLGLPQEKSPEAALCAASFSGAEPSLPAMLLESGSGRELRAAGRERDVIDCGRLNLYDSAPVLREGRFVCWQPGVAGGSWPASAS